MAARSAWQRTFRKYQAMLFTKLKYSPNTVIVRLAALRFFYIHVLKRGWNIAETPYPKKVRHLPGVLSQEEVAQLIEAADTSFHRILPNDPRTSAWGAPDTALRHITCYKYRTYY
jgi:site-specific recombinase XerD